MIKAILRKIKRSANGIFGTKVDELYWKFRHVFDKEWAESYISEGSIGHPHRKLLVDRILAHAPLESVLEIGCASGPNLYLLAKNLPEAKLYGIDISKKAVKTGAKFFKEKNINNVFLGSGKAEELGKFKDKSIDVVFTDAALIYEGPEKIEKAVKEMIRVAKKAVVFCEQHSGDSPVFYKDHWTYDYLSLLGKFVSKEKIKTTKILPEIWGGDWGEFGYIIEALL